MLRTVFYINGGNTSRKAPPQLCLVCFKCKDIDNQRGFPGTRDAVLSVPAVFSLDRLVYLRKEASTSNLGGKSALDKSSAAVGLASASAINSHLITCKVEIMNKLLQSHYSCHRCRCRGCRDGGRITERSWKAKHNAIAGHDLSPASLSISNGSKLEHPCGYGVAAAGSIDRHRPPSRGNRSSSNHHRAS